MFRFLHLADVHLDTRFLGRSEELRQLLRDSQFNAFKRSIDLALAEEANAVLIAGDLFDNNRLSFSTERFLLEQLHRLDQASIPCIYVTGNHDPGSRNCRAQNIEWPRNFHLFGDPDPREIEIADKQGHPVARVVGAGHDNPTEDRNLVPQFPRCKRGGIPTVGLLHTFVTTAKSAEQHDRYAPCSSLDLESRDYAYWALGHVHAHQQVSENVDAWYPGVLQGRHPGESGPKGGLMVSIPDSGSPSVEFRAFSEAIWERLLLNNLEEVSSLSELKRIAATKFGAKREANLPAKDWLLRFDLEGPCPLTDLLRDPAEVEDLEEELGVFLDAPFVEVRSRLLSPFCDVESFRGDAHVLSEILRFIEEASNNSALLQNLSPRVLAGPVDEFGDKERYLKELLCGLDSEVVNRLVDRSDAHQGV